MEETVIVKWRGPYHINNVPLLGADTTRCIYAVTRRWGDNENLLYIGRTKRNLRQRIKEHTSWLSETKGIHIRFGVIELANNQKWSDKRFNDVEALLITVLHPPENTSNYMYYYGRNVLNIKNCGRRGPIDQYVSSKQLQWAE